MEEWEKVLIFYCYWRNGLGRLYSNRCIYEGDWVNDIKQGKGLLIKDGIQYYGEFKHNIKDGDGIQICDDGTIYKG